MNQELDLLELKVKALGFRDADDFIRKNKNKLSERHLNMLTIIGFDFRD
jgi:hypothetical protein